MESARAVRVGDALYRPLLDMSLSKEDVQKARLELNEVPREHKRHLVRVRELLNKEKDLVARTDDAFLMRFLRARKFNDERAAKLVADHYRYRSRNPKLFRRPKELEPLYRCNIFDYLAHRDAQGRAVFLMKIGPWCVERFSFKEFVGAGNVLSAWALRSPVTQVNGFVGIWDFRDYSFAHFSHSCTPRLMWMLCSLMQDCFPGRFKVAYCVNCPPLADAVWKLFKPLLREKYRKRVVVVGSDMKELHKHIHPSVLPEEYGGELPPSDCSDAVDHLLATDHEWDKHQRYGFKAHLRACKDEEDDPLLKTAPKEEACVA